VSIERPVRPLPRSTITNLPSFQFFPLPFFMLTFFFLLLSLIFICTSILPAFFHSSFTVPRFIFPHSTFNNVSACWLDLNLLLAGKRGGFVNLSACWRDHQSKSLSACWLDLNLLLAGKRGGFVNHQSKSLSAYRRDTRPSLVLYSCHTLTPLLPFTRISHPVIKEQPQKASRISIFSPLSVVKTIL